MSDSTKSLTNMCHDANSSIATLSIALESSEKIISKIGYLNEIKDRNIIDKTLNVINGALSELEHLDLLIKGVISYLLEQKKC